LAERIDSWLVWASAVPASRQATAVAQVSAIRFDIVGFLLDRVRRYSDRR
jgi:hypothetical protein